MLLHRVEEHLRITRTPPTRFGREALGDPRFVFDLREGREPRSLTVARVLAYMDAIAGTPAGRSGSGQLGIAGAAH